MMVMMMMVMNFKRKFVTSLFLEITFENFAVNLNFQK